MNYQVFSYMPNPSVATADPPPRPIRVTPSALSPLLYAILYSIEFQAPVGPRPATLRDHSAGRRSSSASGSGGGSGGSAAAPSATALLTSAVSVMSSFWGRTSTNAAATTPSSTPQQQPQKTAPAFGSAGWSAIAGANPTATSLSPPQALTLAEEAELAALQRQHEQPFVVPVTQVLHKLGGVHITVRETHNPTITTAYARAMEEVETMVAEHEQRLARQSLRSVSFPSQPGGTPTAAATSSASQSVVALIQSAGDTTTTTNAATGHDAAPTRDDTTTERYGRAGTAFGAAVTAAAGEGEKQPLVPPVEMSRLSMSPASPTSMLRMGSPASGGATAAWAAANNNGNSSNAYYPSRIDEYTPGPDEVGLVLSVRLLSKEVTRWRITHERPLAEWRFPIIRTPSERMVIRPSAQSPVFSSSVASNAGGSASQDLREAANEGGVAGHDYILVNDAAQMHQVLEFILKSSYQTTSMETFTDFTSGELIFDAHVQERRRFL